MKKRKAKIINDKKLRGEWAESVFMERATEQGLPVSKPWGDSNSFDCVVGRPGKFVGVQVKSTIANLESGKGYICSTCSSHKAYRSGSFDFLAAYVVPEDVWYIIPAKQIRGLKSISLCTPGDGAKYEPYREAWHLLKEAAQGEAVNDPVASEDEQIDHPSNTALRLRSGQAPGGAADESPQPRFPSGAMGRMQASFDYVRRCMERSGTAPPKRDEES